MVSVEHTTTYALYLIIYKKRKLGKENYYFHAKYENGTFFKMYEMFRIRMQPMMLRTLWYFQHQYFQRTSSLGLLAEWGGSSRTDAQVLRQLCPSDNISPKMQPAVALWNIIVMFHRLPHFCLFISNCENSFNFWWSGQ